MSSHVKGVSEVAQQLTDLNKQASAVAQSLTKNIGDAKEALEIADEVSQALGKAAGELRGILGITTNRPPGESG